MNDLDLIRGVLDDTPYPSADRLGAGRARLMAAAEADRITARRPARAVLPDWAAWQGWRARRGWAMQRRRPAWVAAVALVAAALTAVAVAATTGGGVTTYRASLAADVLRTAARTVAAEPPAEPAASKWLYVEDVSVVKGNVVAHNQYWERFDGTESASEHAGGPIIILRVPAPYIPVVEPSHSALAAFHNDPSPLTAYNALVSLPRDPAALLGAVNGQLRWTEPGPAGQTTGQREFVYLTNLLTMAMVAPPTGLAAVYQAIATFPGVTVSEGITDPAGRAAIGVTDDGGVNQFLLDPRTYQVIGWNGSDSNPVAGTYTYGYAWVRIAQVTGPGQR
jgi:hypothetical protein